jgi:hypothetical protein
MNSIFETWKFHGMFFEIFSILFEIGQPSCYYPWCNLYFQVITFDEYCFILFLTSLMYSPKDENHLS